MLGLIERDARSAALSARARQLTPQASEREGLNWLKHLPRFAGAKRLWIARLTRSVMHAGRRSAKAFPAGEQ